MPKRVGIARIEAERRGNSETIIGSLKRSSWSSKLTFIDLYFIVNIANC